MKHYRPRREILEEIDLILREVPQQHSHPLECVFQLLQEGRQYSSASVSIVGHDGLRCAAVSGSDRPSAQRVVVPIKIAGRVLGEVAVQPAPKRPLSAEDRVLLKEVATRVARFLTGNGKHILLTFLQQGSTPARPMSAGK